MQILGVDDRGRSFVVWEAAALGAVVALVLGVALGVVFDHASPTENTTTTPASSDVDGCVSAVERAGTALARAQALDAALTAHTDVVSELQAGRITQAQALQRMRPVLTDGARSSMQLDVEDQLFRELATVCVR